MNLLRWSFVSTVSRCSTLDVTNAHFSATSALVLPKNVHFIASKGPGHGKVLSAAPARSGRDTTRATPRMEALHPV
eukprot:COSAG01_NODE_15568_length_1322_cov_2748.682747_1_plen_75_part_10